MKKILILISIIFLGFASFGQSGFPNNPTQGALQTNNHFIGAVTGDKGVGLPVLTDTTAWNLQPYTKLVPFIMVATSDGKVWYRNASATGWVLYSTGNNWSLLGNAGTVGGTNFIGTTDNVQLDLRTNNNVRLILPASGLTFNQLVTDTTANKVMTFNPSSKAWGYGYWYGGGSSSTPTWQQTLTAGSTLTGANTIAGGGYQFTWNNVNGFLVNSNDDIALTNNTATATSQLSLGDGSNTLSVANLGGHGSQIDLYVDSINIKPPVGVLRIDSLTNVAARYVLHYNPTTGLVSYADTTAAGSGTLTGFTTFGSTPNANGGSVSGANIILQPADGTNPGGVSTTTQTFAGTKTLTSPVITTSLTTGSSTFGLLSSTATTINFAGASGAAINLGGGATAAELRFLEGSAGGTNYVGFKSPATLAANNIYTLPTAFPAATYLLQSTSAGVMSFIDPATIPGTFALTPGNGTTASGTAVNLGGTVTAAWYVDGSAGAYSQKIAGKNSGIDIANNITYIGDVNTATNQNRFSIDDALNTAKYDNAGHNGIFGINKTPTKALDVLGGLKVTDGYDSIYLSSQSSFTINVPNSSYGSGFYIIDGSIGSTAALGDVLTLQDPLTGGANWQPLSLILGGTTFQNPILGGIATLYQDSAGLLQASSILQQTQGADVASANNLILGTDGDVFEITGTTQINLISKTGRTNGNEVTLMFTGNVTVKNNQTTSGSNIKIKLAGGADFSATADDLLTLVLGEIGGTQVWREKSRSVN